MGHQQAIVSARRRPTKQRTRRRGAIAVLAAFFMIVLLGMAAFAIDLGNLYVARGEAQRAADAAAMAAAWELVSAVDPGTSSSTDTIRANARESAQNMAAANPIRGAAPNVSLNAGNASSGDIVLGRLNDLTDPTEELSFPSTGNYNAVQVRVQRTAQQNGAIAFFFARVLGQQSAEITATATAAFNTGIQGFRTTANGPNPSVLPFVLHEDTFAQYQDGTGSFSDSWSYDSETGSVRSGTDGIQEIRVFADGNGGGSSGNGNGKGKGKSDSSSGNGSITSGNFGTVDIGNPNNAAPDLWRQIREGPSHSDLNYHNGELKLGSSGSLSLNGDTGVTASMKDALDDILGQPRTVLLYRSVSGNGNNAQFEIVGFVGVRLVDFSLTGSDKYLLFQPALVSDPTAIRGSSGSSTYITQPVQLVR